jgi:UDP-2,4-diacetamido-2,4,6-trideoxy-beta-L-altropyranose hydrolase
VIDDLANRRHDADLILDQTPGRQDRAYRDLSPPDCRFLLGPRFALLRAEFVEARSRSLERRRAEERFRNVVVSFGGVDSKNMTAKALDGVAQSGLDAEIVVVMGPSAPHLVSVRDKIDRLRATGKKIELLVNTNKMADSLVAADLALGAVGGTAWERCVLGLPTIAVSLAENQDGAAQALSALGAILHLGRHDQVDASAIAAALRGLALDPARRRAMSEAAAAVCDGRGARRAAEAMMELAA